MLKGRVPRGVAQSDNRKAVRHRFHYFDLLAGGADQGTNGETGIDIERLELGNGPHYLDTVDGAPAAGPVSDHLESEVMRLLANSGQDFRDEIKIGLHVERDCLRPQIAARSCRYCSTPRVRSPSGYA